MCVATPYDLCATCPLADEGKCVDDLFGAGVERIVEGGLDGGAKDKVVGDSRLRMGTSSRDGTDTQVGAELLKQRAL